MTRCKERVGGGKWGTPLFGGGLLVEQHGEKWEGA